MIQGGFRALRTSMTQALSTTRHVGAQMTALLLYYVQQRKRFNWFGKSFVTAEGGFRALRTSMAQALGTTRHFGTRVTACRSDHIDG